MREALHCSSSSGSPIHLASSQQHFLHMALLASVQPPVSRGCSCHGATGSTGGLGTTSAPSATMRSPGLLLGAAVQERAQMSTSSCGTLQVPPIWGAEGDGEELQMPCAPAPRAGYHPSSHRHIPAAPHPQVTPLVLHQGDKVPTHGWGVFPLVPWLGSALPMPVCASPQGSSHGPSPTGSVSPLPAGGLSPGFLITGGQQHKNQQHPGRCGAGSGHLVPPTAGGEPQPSGCPGLDTKWKREPQKSPVKAVFEFLAWQQLL